jgi:hypothetical protein
MHVRCICVCICSDDVSSLGTRVLTELAAACCSGSHGAFFGSEYFPILWVKKILRLGMEATSLSTV